MKLQPLNDKVLILPVPAETKTPGGIIIPGNIENKPTRGTVVAIGPKAYGKPRLDDPFLVENTPLTIGAQVLFPLYGGIEIDLDGVKHRLLPAEELLGVIQTS